jgi:hypothetical protein
MAAACRTSWGTMGTACAVMMLLGWFLGRTARADDAIWEPMRPNPIGYAAAFDPVHGRTLVALSSTSPPYKFAEWDGELWHSSAVASSPSPAGLLCFDSDRGVFDLYDGSGFASLMYEGGASGWSFRSNGGPSARFGSNMVYDSGHHVAVLFGGLWSYNQPMETSTWLWNGTTWSSRAANGPVWRTGHVMAYDVQRGVVVLFGGCGDTVYGDTWEWDGTSWTQRMVAGPSPRHDGTMVYDSTRHVCVLFGGMSGSGGLSDIWEWDGATWAMRAPIGPPVQLGTPMAFDSVHNRTLLFGTGEGVWEWNGTAWTPRCRAVPPRLAPVISYDSDRGRTVLFGGVLVGNQQLMQDTWEFDGTGWVQRATTGPRNRTGPAMTYDSVRHATVLFGGRTLGNINTNETWTWNATAWSLQPPGGPSNRSDHAMVFDAQRGETVLFGGKSNTGAANGETWVWDGLHWTQRAIAGPSPRYGHAMVFDRTRHVVILFGGTDGTSMLGDVWEWNGAQWTLRSTTGPARAYHAMMYDLDTYNVVVFGGSANPSSWGGGTWYWDGQNWSQQTIPGPSGGIRPLLVFDEQHRFGVLYNFGETSRLAPYCYQPAFTAQPTSRLVCPGVTISLSVAMSSMTTGPAAYQWRKDGASLDAAVNQWARSSTLWLVGARTEDAGRYECVVATPCGTITSLAAVVRVCAADYNCSGGLSVQDVFDYLNGWFGQQSRADMNGDGALTAEDIFSFVGMWFAGC